MNDMSGHGKMKGGGGLKVHADLIQGSDEWLQARCGLLTASEMRLILTPTLKAASNDKEHQHLYELLAQRITGYVEPSYISDDMLRGMDDEAEARRLYAEQYGPVETVGFMTNDQWGFTIGYSPDGLVGDDGLIECKSRRQKYQIQTFCDDEVPTDYVMQLQTGLLVSGRKWIDFVSYSGGLPMFVKRMWPDEKIQAAILEAATGFERNLSSKMAAYCRRAADLPLTERRVEQEMFV